MMGTEFSQGLCAGLQLELGQFMMTVDSNFFELGWLDLILGVAWLKSFGKVVMEWKDMSMEFQQGEQK